MTRTVHLNFLSRPQSRWPWLLAAGLALMTALGHHREINQSLEAAQLVQKEQRDNLLHNRAALPELPDLQWPWDAMLSSLEAANQEEIVLLSLEAEGRTGQLQLLAETPEPKNLQPYLQKLANQGLRAPRLTRQAAVELDGGPALIQFSIEATWHP